MSKQRCCEAAGYVVPAAVLVLLPKCPACIVAWLAIGAGLGVTITTAAYLRMSLLVLCVACLAGVAARRVFRRACWRARRRRTSKTVDGIPRSGPLIQ